MSLMFEVVRLTTVVTEGEELQVTFELSGRAVCLAECLRRDGYVNEYDTPRMRLLTAVPGEGKSAIGFRDDWRARLTGVPGCGQDTMAKVRDAFARALQDTFGQEYENTELYAFFNALWAYVEGSYDDPSWGHDRRGDVILTVNDPLDVLPWEALWFSMRRGSAPEKWAGLASSAVSDESRLALLLREPTRSRWNLIAPITSQVTYCSAALAQVEQELTSWLLSETANVQDCCSLFGVACDSVCQNQGAMRNATPSPQVSHQADDVSFKSMFQSGNNVHVDTYVGPFPDSYVSPSDYLSITRGPHRNLVVSAIPTNCGDTSQYVGGILALACHHKSTTCELAVSAAAPVPPRNAVLLTAGLLATCLRDHGGESLPPWRLARGLMEGLDRCEVGARLLPNTVLCAAAPRMLAQQSTTGHVGWPFASPETEYKRVVCDLFEGAATETLKRVCRDAQYDTRGFETLGCPDFAIRLLEDWRGKKPDQLRSLAEELVKAQGGVPLFQEMAQECRGAPALGPAQEESNVASR